MGIAKILLFIICCMVFIGIADANTLKDDPPTIFYPAGHFLEGLPRTIGNDIYGYNYQAHRFNGYFANVYLGGDGYPPYWGDTEDYYQLLVDIGLAATVEEAETMLSAWWYWPDRDTRLVMKWNDAWLSNQDRGDDSLGTVPDGNLDRHYGYPAYAGSGAWLTNHQSGKYEMVKKGKVKLVHWSWFQKAIAPPTAAVKINDVWYTEDGAEIGPAFLGIYAIIQTIDNDPLNMAHGKAYGSPNGPGLGKYGPE
jgi:hypothetical protein